MAEYTMAEYTMAEYTMAEYTIWLNIQYYIVSKACYTFHLTNIVTEKIATW